MDINILNQDLELLAIIDAYKSVVWTEKYSSFGTVELIIPISTPAAEYLQTDNYLSIKKSDRIMVIEEIEIITDVEEGDYYVIRGRSSESILDRRIIWNITSLSGSLPGVIEWLLNENIINPVDSNRKIPNFIYEWNMDPTVMGIDVNVQYFGENLYEAVSTLLQSNDLGFMVYRNALNQNVFKVTKGVDYSLNQTINPVIIFSPEYDNLISSSYIESITNFKNVTLVGGEGEGSDRVLISVNNHIIGMKRREMFTDASDTTSDIKLTGDETEAIVAPGYDDILRQRGRDALWEVSNTKAFEGEADVLTQFVYGKDFVLGDIIQIMDKYGNSDGVRVTEIAFSQDASGETTIPTFTK